MGFSSHLWRLPRRAKRDALLRTLLRALVRAWVMRGVIVGGVPMPHSVGTGLESSKQGIGPSVGSNDGLDF